MGKTKAVDPARVREKLDILEPRLAALLKQADEETDMKKKVKLAKKADQIRDKIRQAKTGERFSRQTKRDLIAYSFIAPNFTALPFLLWALCCLLLYWAFFKWDGNNPMDFVGLDNFMQMVGNKRFLASLKNTVVYCVATVPFTLAVALGLAVLLNQKVKGRNFFRTVSFFPYVASLVAVAAVWNMLFSPAKSGPVNMILYNLGRCGEGAAKMVCRQGLGYVHRNPVLCMEKYGILHGDLSGRLTGDQRRALRSMQLGWSQYMAEIPLYHLAPASADHLFCYHYPYHQLL